MPTPQLKALVVDDDPIVRTMLAFALGAEDFSCVAAADGDEALTRLRAEHFDLVVTDLRMPGKHGHTLAVEIIANRDRPVVVIHSGVDEPRLIKDLLSRGVDDFIPKPTNYSAFASKVRVLIQRRRASESQATKTSVDDPDSQFAAGPNPEKAEKTASGDGAWKTTAEGELDRVFVETAGMPSAVEPQNGLLSAGEVREVLQGGHLKLAPPPIERRSAERWPHPTSELLAACDQGGGLPTVSMFREVLCYELSAVGISFFLPRPPSFQAAVITLGKSTDEVSMLIHVVHCTEYEATGRKRYLVGGKFERRVSGRELAGSRSLAYSG